MIVSPCQHSVDSGLTALTNPLVQGLVNPLTLGVGKGVAGAASTQQFADLLGQALAMVCSLFPEPDNMYFDCDLALQIMHTLGGIAANTEQGVCVLFLKISPRFVSCHV